MSRIIKTLGNKLSLMFPRLWLFRQRRIYIKRYSAEARKYFATATDIPEGATLADYLDALEKHLVMPKEYLSVYEMYKLNEEERSSIISVPATFMLYHRLRLYYPEHYDPAFFINKETFLSFATSNGLIHRKWLFAPDATRDQLEQLLRSTDCIYKLNNQSHGDGIHKIHHDNEEEIQTALSNAVAQRAVIEECIVGHEALQVFHPASLNTIRVVTLAHEGRSAIVTSFLRVGAGGHVVDNVGAGGLKANIDIETGIIDSDGFYHDGRHATHHPDTGVAFNGARIPNWDKVKSLCIKAAAMVNQSIVVGWDIAVTQAGEAEIIEANSLPDSISCKQMTTRQGDKKRIENSVYQIIGKHYDL